MLEQVRLQLPTPEIGALHLKAAIAYDTRGEYAEAHQQYLLAGDLLAAANLVERVSDEYIEHGRLETVIHWLRGTPEEIIGARPWLLAAYGKALCRSGDNSAALDKLACAYRLFEKEDNKRGLAWVAYELGMVHYYEKRSEEGVKIAERLLAGPDVVQETRARLLTALGMNYLDLDEIGRAEESGRAALSNSSGLPSNPETALFASRANRLLALANARQGRLRPALESVQSCLALCRQWKLDDHEMARVYCTQGQVLSLSGELLNALQALDAAEDAGGRHDHLLWKKINLWRGNVHRDRGDYDLASESYHLAEDRALVERAYMLLRQGEIQKAMSALRLASGTCEGRQGLVDQAIANATLGLVFEACGEMDLASEHLRLAIRVFEEKGIRQRLASAHCHLAYLEFKSGKSPAGVSHLDAALGIAADCDLVHFNWWDAAKFAFLVGQALRTGTRTQQVARMLKAKLTGDCRTQLLTLFVFPDADVRDVVDRILVEMADLSLSSPDVSKRIVDNLLWDCTDAEVGKRIRAFIYGGVLSVDSLARLRNRHGLTWREIEVFCAYYLRADQGQRQEGFSRRHVADLLCMAENTLKVHVGSIRRKIGLASGPGDDWVAIRSAIAADDGDSRANESAARGA
ncbi:MAG: helix-turn-helix domain-containing protein [Chloroflexota bacterium]